MSKIFTTITGVVALAGAAVVGKICYDAYMDRRKRAGLDQDFFDDIEDDFDAMFSSPVNVAPTDEAPAKTEAPTKEEPKKEETVAKPKAAASKSKASTTKPKATKKQPAKKSSSKKATSSLTCEDVIDCTSNVLGISAEDILSKSRKADIANARRVAIYICATKLDVTNADICEGFGGIGATSVTNAKKNITDKMKEDKELSADVNDILAEMKKLEDSFNKK